MYKIKPLNEVRDHFEFMTNLAKLTESVRLSKYKFDKMVLNKRRNQK